MTKRVGLLVPSSNTVMEADFYRNLPASVTVHTGRMYMESTTVQGEGLMLDEYTLPAAKILATAKPDVVVFGCTSAGALRGNAYDTELCQRISEVTGRPTISVIESVRRKLSATRATRVAVLTPLEASGDGGLHRQPNSHPLPERFRLVLDRNGEPIFLKALQVAADCVGHHITRFFERVAFRDQPRQRRTSHRVAGLLRRLEDHRITVLGRGDGFFAYHNKFSLIPASP